MDTEIIDKQEMSEKDVKPNKYKSYVYTIRDWKEYLGESLLIIFSVLFALILSEYFNNIRDKENTRTMLKNIVSELNHNKKAIQEMKLYNTLVLQNIDSILTNKNLQNQLVLNDEFKLSLIAPQGILYRYLNDEAWTIAKNNNVISKVDVETVALLTKVYEDQTKMMKVEDEVAKVLFDRASRDTRQVHTTLILIRDLYHGWVVDRTNGVLQQIDNTVAKVKDY
jgi:hypothetical protein